MCPNLVIVDDEPDLCRILEAAITGRYPDVKAHSAYDGEAGLALIQKVRPDVAILDIKMPKANGYEVLNRVRQQPELSATKVIMLTSLTQNSGKSDEAWAESLEVAAFISKPYEMETLLKRLEEISGWERRGESADR